MITFTSLVGEATRPPAQLVPPRWSSTLDLLSRCRAPSRCLDTAKKPKPKRQLLELSPIISRHPYLSPTTLCMFFKLHSNTCERSKARSPAPVLMHASVHPIGNNAFFWVFSLISFPGSSAS